ncbi:phage tail assembly chaperone [Mesorhizobium sp. M2D.F.Ca.ET.223.01.1.1]|uniref:phage tail assembly chaperone n=1 Tax=unclassified Mesorhizobium TaxID=325217 RepID=UPI000FCC8D55|nr:MULTISPECIES: phage tail assembly chaperone [unclassified Mesorhizobium]TGP89354.1 phage tail assembly chaperone [bacterium M00.F.Ca.ET.221.01.1.1]TGP94727.1 phage tail assembly chaperone [bacterium M00.F.Ca.ET.222.01.1.1]RVD58859.1 phage tail assembly chaperone [Mesorhizobium sp. M2D.F.Ca.ET.140.01.1.1]TGP27888.1 phage tail assembly chaperone [Mesorhizobium sp. M2D.F.Ca.ET.232.01.1.1]TGP75895.1 phage tail assembly chaperone [Mesorhizobium sp. M2D.F.Ca.ET.224.01.1.1]
MCTALGVLKWPADKFWRSTVYEYTTAIKGHLISIGADLTPELTREEVNAAFREYENRVKASMGGN